MTDPTRRRIPIQRVLVGSFVLVAALSILFLSVQRYVDVTGALHREVLEQDLELARAVAGGLDRLVAESRHVVDTLAHEIEEQRLVRDRPALQRLVENASRREIAFNALAVTDDRGIALAITPRLNEQGRPNVGMHLADRQWFTDVMVSAPRSSFDVLIGRAHGRPTVAAAAPIRSREGAVVGVVAAGLDLDYLRRSIRAANPGSSDRLIVVDARGRVIAHTSPQWEAEARDLSTEAVFRAAQAREAGTTEYRSLYSGTMRWGAYVRMPSTGWVVWASRGPESREAKVRSLVRGLLWSGLAASLIALVAALLVSRLLARPLKGLAEATQRIASGRFETDPLQLAGDSRIREFSELLAGFRTMAERLRLQHEGLEAQVAERTRALEQATRDAQATAALLQAEEEIRRGYGELAALLNSLDRSHILDEGTKKIAASLHAPVAAVYLTDDGPASLRLKTYVAVDPGVLDAGLLSPAGLPSHVAQRGEPVVIALSHATERLTLRRVLVPSRSRAWRGSPCAIRTVCSACLS